MFLFKLSHLWQLGAFSYKLVCPPDMFSSIFCCCIFGVLWGERFPTLEKNKCSKFIFHLLCASLWFTFSPKSPSSFHWITLFRKSIYDLMTFLKYMIDLRTGLVFFLTYTCSLCNILHQLYLNKNCDDNTKSPCTPHI